MDLYRQILPTTGFYCVAKQFGDGFQHFFHNTVEDALQRAKILDNAGHTVYIAQSSFSTITSRKQSNVEKVRSLWLDLDCGEGKPYPSQVEAGQALARFCKALDIAMPVVVRSGNGLYAHLPLDAEMVPATWAGLATLFRKCCETNGLMADHSRTCDCSSVLRPVGATHRKDPNNPKIVTQLNDVRVYSTLDLVAKMKSYLSVNGVKLAKPKQNQDVNSEFAVFDANVKMNARVIVQKCAQVAFFRDNPSKVSEPLWYATIGMLRYAENGEDVCHEWSKGYPGYSREETERKINQHIEANIAPTTCNMLNNVNPGFCESCKFAGKITTPLQLGREVKKEFTPENVDEVMPTPPPGYSITNSGIVRSSDEGDAVLCPDPIYPVRFGYDLAQGYETTTFRHKRPLNGWQEITVRSSLVHDPKAFCMFLMDKSCLVGSNERKGFMNYIELFSMQLRKKQEIKQVASQQGWCEEQTKFLLGTALYERGGKISEVGMADAASNVIKDIKIVGDWEQWVAATGLFNAPNMKGHAFALLAGAFGAPLMKFSGYSGAMLSLVGSSGVGKSLVGQFALSAYGDPSKLMLLRDDTKNALMARMGFYNNLPAYIDEISNIPGDELSELVYRVTQGREKNRLTKNSIEKSNVNEWQTLTLASSNHSLIEKLSNAKGDASAEMNRIFEYELVSSVDRDMGTRCYNLFTQNYGGVGARYIQHLVDNTDKHKDNIAKVIKMIDDRTKAQNEERFWSAVAGVTIYGGLIASKLGLIRFSIEPIIEWVVGVIKDMRACKKDNVSDLVSTMSSIIDKFINNIVVVDDYDAKDKLKIRVPIREPRGALLGRIELASNRLWFNREVIAKELFARTLSAGKVETYLRDKGIIVGRKTINLGRGTCYAVGSVQSLEIDLTHPDMGFCRMRLVDTFGNKEIKEALKNG